MSATKPTRRIVTIDDEQGRSGAIADGPSPDRRSDPARPGFITERMWVTHGSPPGIGDYRDPVLGPHTIEPPRNGTVCRVVTFPPDASFRGKIGSAEVAAFFHAMGSPGASTYSAKAPHPYMQKASTLDFCLVLEGEITLILDTAEVPLKAGDTVVQRGNQPRLEQSLGPAVRGGNLLARRGVKHSCFRLDLPFVSAEAGTQDVAKS